MDHTSLRFVTGTEIVHPTMTNRETASESPKLSAAPFHLTFSGLSNYCLSLEESPIRVQLDGQKKIRWPCLHRRRHTILLPLSN